MNKTADPLILEIKGNSLDDGPGIRSVIFFKGCPLNCVWCHNPESKSREAELSFDASLCTRCFSCISVCKKQALSKNSTPFIKKPPCNLCFECTDVCPSSALARTGKQMSVEEITGIVLRDKPFFDVSHGGVTLSGGEPTIGMDFVMSLLQSFKIQGVHTLLETCGCFNFEQFKTKIYPLLDLIYIDIKIIDPVKHKKYCGITNEVILENFRSLYKLYKNGGIEVLPRVPLIPGMTDGPENLASIAAYLRQNNADKIALLPYNPLWRDKFSKLGLETPVTSDARLERFMKNDEIEACRSHFAGFEIF